MLKYSIMSRFYLNTNAESILREVVLNNIKIGRSIMSRNTIIAIHFKFAYDPKLAIML
jgi:hypothetical protein